MPKRQRIGNRYISRRKDGTISKNVDVGRSISADRRNNAKKTVKAGYGDKGDIKRAEGFGADEGLGYIINPASIGKGLPTFWAFDVYNDQVNYQTCLTCTQPIDYEIDEDDDFSGVQCRSCESKYEYRDIDSVKYKVGDEEGYYLIKDAEEFGADGMDFKEATKTGFGIAAGFTLFNLSLFGIAAVAGIVMSKK
jgi:DNA-directed RNA polymerase subunit RPC12/RpoP